MNNQYKPLPKPGPIDGCVNQASAVSSEGIGGTLTQCKEMNPNGIEGSETFAPKTIKNSTEID